MAPGKLLRSLAAMTAAVAMLLGASEAAASPQGTVGLTLGAAGVGDQRAVWDETVFQLGLRGDVLFGRTSNRDFGLGPFVELQTLGFHDLQVGGGASALLPILDNFPLVLSGGAYGRATSAYGFEPGITGQLFWGSRSYNYHASYIMSAGLLAQFRYGLGDARETAIVVGAQLDLEVLSLPFVFLFEAISGPSAEAAPIAR
jgi:hypothetical protein